MADPRAWGCCAAPCWLAATTTSRLVKCCPVLPCDALMCCPGIRCRRCCPLPCCMQEVPRGGSPPPPPSRLVPPVWWHAVMRPCRRPVILLPPYDPVSLLTPALLACCRRYPRALRARSLPLVAARRRRKAAAARWVGGLAGRRRRGQTRGGRADAERGWEAAARRVRSPQRPWLASVGLRRQSR